MKKIIFTILLIFTLLLSSVSVSAISFSDFISGSILPFTSSGVYLGKICSATNDYQWEGTPGTIVSLSLRAKVNVNVAYITNPRLATYNNLQIKNTRSNPIAYILWHVPLNAEGKWIKWVQIKSENLDVGKTDTIGELNPKENYILSIFFCDINNVQECGNWKPVCRVQDEGTKSERFCKSTNSYESQTHNYFDEGVPFCVSGCKTGYHLNKDSSACEKDPVINPPPPPTCSDTKNCCPTSSHWNGKTCIYCIGSTKWDEGQKKCITTTTPPQPPKDLRGDYDWSSFTYPNWATPMSTITTKAVFTPKVSGRYYLEAGIDDSKTYAYTVVLPEAKGSKCDFKTNFAGDFYDLEAGENYAVPFVIIVPQKEGRFALRLGAYTGCLKDGGKTIAEKSYGITVGTVKVGIADTIKEIITEIEEGKGLGGSVLWILIGAVLILTAVIFYKKKR